MLHIRDHIASLKPSDTLSINQLSQQFISEGKRIYRFGFGQSPFPVPEIVQEALRNNAHQKDYLPVQGLENLRHQVAMHTNGLLNGANYSAENVFIGPGSKELIFLMQVAMEAPLLLPNPSWVSYSPQAKITEKDVHWIETSPSDWKLTAENFESYLNSCNLQKGILLLNYPNNPTGLSYTVQELSDLADVCRSRGILVISDEIYGLLSFDGIYRSMASYYPEGTIVTTGLSKWCGAGGWRLGAAIIPNDLKALNEILKSLASETFSAVSAPIQYAATVAYEDHAELTFYRKTSRAVLSRVAGYCHKVLTDSGVDVCPSQGGFYIFPDFTSNIHETGRTSPSLCKQIMEETGVALLPGSSFGRADHELTTRLSFVDFGGAASLLHYMKFEVIDDEAFVHLFPNIVEGIDALTSWLLKQNSSSERPLRREYSQS